MGLIHILMRLNPRLQTLQGKWSAIRVLSEETESVTVQTVIAMSPQHTTGRFVSDCKTVPVGRTVQM